MQHNTVLFVIKECHADCPQNWPLDKSPLLGTPDAQRASDQHKQPSYYTNLPFPNQLATHVTTAGHPDDCTSPPIICAQQKTRLTARF